jgi:general secretion pathway protein B
VPAKAAGGRVEPATLNASVKTMPPATKTAPVAPHTLSTAGSAPNNHNVPKPPSAYAKPSSAPGNAPANQAVSRPPANNAASRAPSNYRPPAPAPHMQSSTPHSSAPVRSSAPPKHQDKPAPKEHEKH